MGENSVGTLHNALQKWGIRPEYIVHTKKRGFFIQLISPITIGGPSLIVEGSAPSIKAGKRDVATIICSAHRLSKPNYTESAVKDNSRSFSFVTECEISYLRIIARGESRTAAKFEAATKMIRVLMEVGEIRRMLESQYSFPDTTDDGLGDSRAPENEASGKPPPELETNPSSIALRFSSAREFCRKKLADGEDAENSNAGRGFKKGKESIEKSNCDSFNEVLSKIDDTVSGPRSNRICRNLTRLQLISKIDRIVDGFEKQLCNQILESLHYSSNKDPKIVTILSNEYEVLVDRLTDPKIFQGEREYDDKSVRIACLVKILLELRDDDNKGGRMN